MDELCYFQSEIAHDLTAEKELRRSFHLFIPRTYVLRFVIAGCLLINWFSTFPGLYTSDLFARLYFFLLAVNLGTILFLFLRNRNGNIHYKRMLNNNNNLPPRNRISFLSEHMQFLNLDTENRLSYSYDNILSIAQTKHYYVLLMEHRQYIPIQKSTLSGGSEEAFLEFLKANCPNLKPKRLRSNLPGIMANILLGFVFTGGLVLAILDLCSGVFPLF